MPLYQKKPVIVDAIQWDGSIEIGSEISQWANRVSENPGVVRGYHDENGRKLLVETLEGTMTASAGDYIICGIQGEFYPCKPDIFEATYTYVDGQ